MRALLLLPYPYFRCNSHPLCTNHMNSYGGNRINFLDSIFIVFLWAPVLSTKKSWRTRAISKANNFHTDIFIIPNPESIE